MPGGIINNKQIITGNIKPKPNISAVAQIEKLDHNRLINRDAKDQHPITAISGLEERLYEIEHQSKAFDIIDGGTADDWKD